MGRTSEGLQNLTQIKEHYDFLNLKKLSITDFKIKSINKGIFNSMLQLKNLSLSRNGIKSIEHDSFLIDHYESNIIRLYLSENKLTTIKQRTFNGLFKLQILYLDKNEIESIEANSFLTEPFESNIIRLYLSENKLTTIKQRTFNGLFKLQILYLDKNEIESIEANSFLTEPFESNILELYLSENKLTTIKQRTFNGLFKLQILYLDKNEIESIEANSFLTEPFESNILELYLSENKLTTIKQRTFNGLFKLQILYLDKNEIESIEANSFLTEPFESNILELYLSENKLTTIKQRTFNGLFNLQILHLNKNEIAEIEKNSFANLNQLKELKIVSNKIKKIKNEIFFRIESLHCLYLYQNSIENMENIPFNTLFNLKRLHLFSNKIRQIKFGYFIDLHLLDELRLDKNEIVSLELNTFVGLEKLNTLDLSANKIKKIENGVFYELKNLIQLDLHLNDITQIEMNTFIDLNNLKYLNLDSNQISTMKNVQFNSNLEQISLRFNMLTNLNEINSSSLKYLHVSNNRLQEINFKNTFLPNLEYMDLSQNRLILIKAESFFNIKNLKNLNLSYNKLDLESEFKNILHLKGQSLLETLDLSFNEIKYFESNLTFQYLDSLKYLNLSNNKLKFIDSFVFGFLIKLNELNLASNNISFLNASCFFNLRSLKKLSMNFNKINSTDFLKSNKNDLYNLEYLNLEENKIVFINERHFQSYLNLSSLNLNSNPIESIHGNSFMELKLLKTLRLSNTKIDSLFLNSYLRELDLSFLNASISGIEKITNIEWINLANSKVNCSFEFFLSFATKYVDFSYNQFKWDDDSKMFNVIGSALEVLKLRQTNLQKIDHINLKNLINLKHLDLSFNNLSFISQDSFEFNLNLEYLDLSSNSLYEFSIVLNKLKYLNLDNNQINSTNEVLKDYYSIEIFKMTNNRLQKYPSFEMSQIKSENVETFLEFHLNQNQINEIKYFSFIFGKLILANFDSNQINSIETDAFLNCRSLQSLSIVQNRLSNLTGNNFHFLFSLIHLNLSFNEINFIEPNTFSNLNKLKSLNLNYNKLISIEDDLFLGLVNLNDLYLMSQNEITLNKRSFHHLPNISSIVLNESLISNYKCLFMHNLEREIQRNVSNKYIFYKSINFLSLNFTFNDSLNIKCDLTFHLFQFKIHYNLKTDYDNDLFFDSCQKILIKRKNNYNHNKQKCIANFEYNDKEEEFEIDSLHPFLKVLSNLYYLVSMALILSLLIPAFYMIFRYELFSNLISKLSRMSSSDQERNRKLHERTISKNRQKLDKINKIEFKLINEKKFLIEKIEKLMQQNYK
jgi:Leucine-rich repeat (LRR) protein